MEAFAQTLAGGFSLSPLFSVFSEDSDKGERGRESEQREKQRERERSIYLLSGLAYFCSDLFPEVNTHSPIHLTISQADKSTTLSFLVPQLTLRFGI